jgi:UDPglucose 6-dehydrogenase
VEEEGGHEDAALAWDEDALGGKTIGLLGLAFKPDTDDIQESRAVPIIQALLKEKAKIIAFDPVATNNFRPLFPDISYTKTAREVLDADAVLIVTEWKEFEDLDYRNKMVIDGRRIGKARREAAIYEGVCR